MSLEINGSAFPLGAGTFLLGRAPNVDFRIDDPRASRQHAALEVTTDSVVVQDLASRNGVLVNGKPIEGTASLRAGDTITVGSEVMRLVARDDEASHPRRVVRTGAGTERPKPMMGPGDDAQLMTTEADALELLSTIVDRALEQGNPAEAEALISGHLAILLNEARVQRDLKPGACTTATEYALKLARTTGKSRWVDYLFELHTAARRPLSLRVVQELHELAPFAKVSRRQLVDDYTRMFELMNVRDAGAERSLILRRLAGLAE